jgi:MoaA/NifB/PqqE/SkfB family radical SAM enzyme
MQLQIETINICDAKCVFCPYPDMKRPKGTMPMPLFERLIDEAATIPQIDKVTLTGLGEPLLDKHLMERLHLIRNKMQIGCLDLYTNGSRLTMRHIQEFVKVPVDVLYVSLNAISRDGRKQIMGLDDYDHVENILREAIDRFKDCSLKIVVKGVTGTDLMESGVGNEFVSKWGDWSNGGNGFLHLEGNWGGITWKSRTKPSMPCLRALEQIMVLQDGRVSLCCFDSEGDVILGDLNKQSLREVYNSGLAVEYRKAHAEGRRGELKLCSTCTTI